MTETVVSRRMDIHLTRPCTDEAEAEADAAVIRSGWVAQGTQVMEFENRVAEYVSVRFATATNSATSALHLALYLRCVMGPGHTPVFQSYVALLP